MPRFAVVLEGEIESIQAGVFNGRNCVLIEMLDQEVIVYDTAILNGRVVKPETWAPLSISQITSPDPLPGNAAAIRGFVGCTAIVSGNYDGDTKRIEVDHFVNPVGSAGDVGEPFPKVILGPPETVIGGAITPPPATDQLINVNDLPVTVIQQADDLRLPQLPPRNEFGFLVKLPAVGMSVGPQRNDPSGRPLPPPIAVVNGYFGKDDSGKPTVAYGYDVVVDSPDRSILVDPGHQISVTKAQARDRKNISYDINLQGGITLEVGDPATPRRVGVTQRVAVYRNDGNDGQLHRIGPIIDVPDVRGKPFARWRLSATIPYGATPFNQPPQQIIVRNETPAVKLEVGGPVEAAMGERLVEIIKG